MSVKVRELPPWRQYILVTAPNGNTFRWGQDERRPENNFSGLNYSTVVPGGDENLDCVLPRKSGTNYQDMTALSSLRVCGVGGQVAAEYRLEKAPRVSGDQLSISPQAVGMQAYLEDDPEAQEVYVDRDLTHWGPASRAVKLAIYGAGVAVITDPGTDPDATSGIPALNLTTQGTGTAALMRSEAWYDAGPGATIASIYYDMTSNNTVAGDTGQLNTSSDDIATSTSASADLLTGVNSSAAATFTPSPATYRFGRLIYMTSQSNEVDHTELWRRLTVWGNHGLTKQGTAPADGLFASDVIANAVSRWAPNLTYTTGSGGSLQATTLIIPQLEFRTPTTVAEIIKVANRPHLNDWTVEPGVRPNEPVFYYNERGARGKKWRARIGPTNLTETGPQVDRLWNGIIVTYQDVDGSTRRVGPTGTSMDSTDTSLLDTDPLNPINQLGVKRYATLDMGIVSTSAVATEVGRQFLVRSKDLDQSGSADLVGWVTDDKGVVYPSWRVRAGDQISFVDSADSSYRRIVHTNVDYDSRTNSIDLDSPPEGMDALLEQLGASLTVGQPVPNVHSSSGGFATV